MFILLSQIDRQTTCSSRKINAHPMEGYWKFLGVGGILKAKFVEEMYENKAQIPRGGGGAKQKTFHGGVWIFSGTAQ